MRLRGRSTNGRFLTPSAKVLLFDNIPPPNK